MAEFDGVIPRRYGTFPPTEMVLENATYLLDLAVSAMVPPVERRAHPGPQAAQDPCARLMRGLQDALVVRLELLLLYSRSSCADGRPEKADHG